MPGKKRQKGSKKDAKKGSLTKRLEDSGWFILGEPYPTREQFEKDRRK